MAAYQETDSGDHMIRVVGGLCEEVRRRRLLQPGAYAEVETVRSTLTEPLRMAVVGRVSTGKSTMVNALIGRRVAPTAAGECTRVPTWYRYGAPDRATIVLRDGRTRPLPFAGNLPDTLGVDPEHVERIEVVLQSGPLRDLTLVDTPGLGSPGRTVDDVAREAGQASAVLFLFRDVEKADDIEFVRSYRDSAGALDTSNTGVIGVLSHADVFGAGPWADEDPIDGARQLAARIAGDHPDLLAAVVPVSGLLAEAARTGRVTERDSRTLARMAATDRAELQIASVLGIHGDGADDPDAVARVLGYAGPYVLARGRESARGGALSLQNWMVERSGIGELETLVRSRVGGRARPLIADRLLRRLRSLSRHGATSGAAGAELRDMVEQVELRPETHRIVELRALSRLAGRRGGEAERVAWELGLLVDHPGSWRSLGASGPLRPDELQRRVRELRQRAQRTINTARDPVVADAARVLTRAYQLLDRRF